jgi:hypothetical protein
MQRTVDQISSSLKMPFDPGIPDGHIPLSITHFSWPSERDFAGAVAKAADCDFDAMRCLASFDWSSGRDNR